MKAAMKIFWNLLVTAYIVSTQRYSDSSIRSMGAKGFLQLALRPNGAFSSGTTLEQYHDVWYVCQISRDAVVRPSQFGQAPQTGRRINLFLPAWILIENLSHLPNVNSSSFCSQERSCKNMLGSNTGRLRFSFRRAAWPPPLELSGFKIRPHGEVLVFEKPSNSGWLSLSSKVIMCDPRRRSWRVMRYNIAPDGTFQTHGFADSSFAPMSGLLGPPTRGKLAPQLCLVQFIASHGSESINPGLYNTRPF